MKMLFGFLLFTSLAHGQMSKPGYKTPTVWKLNNNKLLTGGLIVLAGASKGFNETLTFHWKMFHNQFPRANGKWFNPAISWRNKYEGGKASNGAKFPLSTSVLVMVTDQYHFNNFINRAAWISAIVIKLGEPKKPFKYYLKDLLFYTACHQLGFGAMYYPFTKAYSKK